MEPQQYINYRPILEELRDFCYEHELYEIEQRDVNMQEEIAALEARHGFQLDETMKIYLELFKGRNYFTTLRTYDIATIDEAMERVVYEVLDEEDWGFQSLLDQIYSIKLVDRVEYDTPVFRSQVIIPLRYTDDNIMIEFIIGGQLNPTLYLSESDKADSFGNIVSFCRGVTRDALLRHRFGTVYFPARPRDSYKNIPWLPYYEALQHKGENPTDLSGERRNFEAQNPYNTDNMNKRERDFIAWLIAENPSLFDIPGYELYEVE